MLNLPLPAFTYVRLCVEGIGWIAIVLVIVAILAAKYSGRIRVELHQDDMRLADRTPEGEREIHAH